MVILDFPYVSEYLQELLIQANIPVIQTSSAAGMNLRSDLNWISEKEAVAAFKSDPGAHMYTNSENAISWISENLGFTEIPETISLFKDKVKFRRLVSSLYPDYFFKELQINDLDKLNKNDLTYPLILKPAVGFFSLGVHKLNNRDDWAKVESEIKKEIIQGSDIYPIEVLNTSRFILEECIQGREFAIDAYFNNDGEAVILNLTEHFFSSSEDMGDRLYQSSSDIFTELFDPFLSALQAIGDLSQLRNFPVHVEVRLRSDNQIIPIEVNPLRFGGWCTTADLAGRSFGINLVEMFHKQQKPDWNKIFSNGQNKAYNLILLDNVTGIDADEIKGFNYDKLGSRFKNVMEIRKVDFREYPIFGFMFVETDKDEEPILKELLKSDLREYLIL